MAALGLVVGGAGLAVALLALRRAHHVVAQSQALVRRLLPDDTGVDSRAVRDIGLVRYDALEQMSGARSFSVALLNAAGDGVVLTSINGRSETRTYAKVVEDGRAQDELSPEEYRAVRAARMGWGPGSSGAHREASLADPAVTDG